MPTLEVQSGVQRPEGLNARQGGGQDLYPFDKMQKKDDFILVPWFWYFGHDKTEEECDLQRYDPKKHRERVNNAARGYALKKNKAASQEPDFDKDNFKPIRFTVAAVNGGVGVWRD